MGPVTDQERDRLYGVFQRGSEIGISIIRDRAGWRHLRLPSLAGASTAVIGPYANLRAALEGMGGLIYPAEVCLRSLSCSGLSDALDRWCAAHNVGRRPVGDLIAMVDDIVARERASDAGPRVILYRWGSWLRSWEAADARVSRALCHEPVKWDAESARARIGGTYGT